MLHSYRIHSLLLRSICLVQWRGKYRVFLFSVCLVMLEYDNWMRTQLKCAKFLTKKYPEHKIIPYIVSGIEYKYATCGNIWDVPKSAWNSIPKRK